MSIVTANFTGAFLFHIYYKIFMTAACSYSLRLGRDVYMYHIPLLCDNGDLVMVLKTSTAVW